jgi:Domain of unknown function (DUF4190)
MSYSNQPPPPPPPGGYEGGGPGGYPGAGAPASNNGKAVTALVVGIVSVILSLSCFCSPLGLIGIVSIVLGRSAQREIQGSGGTQSGDGMARAGFILGIIATAIGAIFAVLWIIAIASGNSTWDFNKYGS